MTILIACSDQVKDNGENEQQQEKEDDTMIDSSKVDHGMSIDTVVEAENWELQKP